MNTVTFFNYYNDSNVSWTTVSVNAKYHPDWHIRQRNQDTGQNIDVINNEKVVAVFADIDSAYKFVKAQFSPAI